MNQFCLICNNSFDSDSSLHKHLRSHKLRIEDYYLQYYSKKDLLTGEPIVFKNKDQYLSSDFNNKNNLNAWIKKVDRNTSSEYFQKLLLTRKEKKNIKYTLSQVECRSLPLPNIIKLHQIFGDYYKTCENLGFINKCHYPLLSAENTQKKIGRAHV